MSTATPKAPAICRHCRAGSLTRPRRLCWSCYYRPDVRALYPPAVQYGSAADAPGEVRAGVTPPPVPTPHRPGSEGKVAALEARAAAGLGLWHPLDAPLDLG